MEDSWNNATNILCIRLDNMGDVLMTTPALRALKQAVPGRRITLLTSSAGAPIARMVPEIDEVLTFDVPWVKTDTPDGPEAVLALADKLKTYIFDGAVIHTVYSQNPMPAAMLCYLAGIPRIAGYCRENPYGLITEWLPDPEPLETIRHEVDRQLDLVRMLGAELPADDDRRLSLQVSDSEHTAVRQLLKDLGVQTDKPWLLLHPGVSEEKRRYPAADYIRACRTLIDEDGYHIILTGSRSERDYCDSIQQQLGDSCVNAADTCSLHTLCALIAEAPLLISNNTGPVHVAAAVGTPVVVLYAMTNPQHTPWQVANRVLYFDVPNHLRSKNRLLQNFPGQAEPKASPEAIVAAVRALGEQHA
ncbi:MAG TPA: glycosyltransferase family 9 protein [Candidatus Limnocylindrales bacterium]|nr:glycosyltransferase family 9 protein [Candidatus Limnocylindrales bacterium]